MLTAERCGLLWVSKMANPLAIVIERKEPVVEPVFLGNQSNTRNVEAIAPQRAPSQPRQGDTPTRPARMPQYVALNINAIRSVMRNTFAFGKGEHDPVIGQPYGKSLAWNERGNVYRPNPEAYGSTFTLEPVRTSDESRIAILMGVPQ